MERKDHIDLFGGSVLVIFAMVMGEPGGDQGRQRWDAACLSSRIALAVCLFCRLGLGLMAGKANRCYRWNLQGRSADGLLVLD